MSNAIIFVKRTLFSCNFASFADYNFVNLLVDVAYTIICQSSLLSLGFDILYLFCHALQHFFCKKYAIMVVPKRIGMKMYVKFVPTIRFVNWNSEQN